MNRIDIPIQIKGFRKFTAYQPSTGRSRVLVPYYPNRILDSGRNYAGSNDWLTHAQVGTAATPVPSPSDTGLQGWFAGTANIISDQNGAQSGAPWFGWRRITWEFDKGATAANLSEAGAGWGLSGATLMSRDLILDPVTQLPTTITPLADEILRMTYEMRYYPPTGDVNGTVTLDGLVYDTVTRACQVNDVDLQSGTIGDEFGVRDAGDPTAFAAFDDEIGTIDSSPSGLSATIDGTPTNLAYSNNSYQRDIVLNCGGGSGIGTGWYLASGIRSIIVTTSAGRFQTRFGRQGGGDETVPKTNLKQMSLTYRLTWVEGSI